MSGNMAERWREVHGEKNWEGLLDPLDIDLRESIIRYGEMVMATYEAFIAEKKSPHAGMCRWSKADFFKKAEVSNPEYYRVTRYLYATASADIPGKFIFKALSREAQERECNWMGYVAVATDEGKKAVGRRDIVVAWRGTQEALEWVDDLEVLPTSAARILGHYAHGHDPKVHRGYMAIYTSSDLQSKFRKDSARMQVLGELVRLLNEYAEEEMSITVIGHSLGATVAIINSVDIVANGYNKPQDNPDNVVPVSAIVLGTPRVGTDHFKHIYESIPNLHCLRIRNAPDLIPDWPPFGFHAVGVELRIDTRRSPYLKPPKGAGPKHDLEVHLHGIAGWQGEHKDFELVVDRDLALCNKYDDILDDKHPVPSGWRVPKNKGMKRMPDGRWVLEDHETDYMMDLMEDLQISRT